MTTIGTSSSSSSSLTKGGNAPFDKEQTSSAGDGTSKSFPQESPARHAHCAFHLSQSPTNGALLTVPLRSVIAAMTHTLYQDLYNMTTGAEELRTFASSADETPKSPGKETQKIMTMLSFAARRHELSLRLHRHARAAAHSTALVSAYSSLLSSDNSNIVQTCSNAFSEAFVQTRFGADEAQDALFFHHNELWKVRQHPHDVLGATQLLTQGTWVDFPKDVQLSTQYEDYEQQNKLSENKATQQLSRQETLAKLQSCVRRKLLLGEVGQHAMQEDNTFKMKQKKQYWNIALESNGCVVKLYHGCRNSSSSKYAMEAKLTVLDEEDNAPWTLLSLDIHAQPKTGESSHQLEPNNRQKLNLHLLCAKAMGIEESTSNKKPLDCLFTMAHTFALSLQLEILSAQAEALKRGMWEISSLSSKDKNRRGLHVSPIQYYNNTVTSHEKRKHQMEETNTEDSIAILAIHFWHVDDRYGIPKVRDVELSDDDIRNNDNNAKYFQDIAATSNNIASTTEHASSQGAAQSRFTMYIRAIPRKGLILSLPGGEAVMKGLHSDEHSENYANIFIKRNFKKLQQSIQNPFSLSAADAILAATYICAHLKCVAVVDALMTATKRNSKNSNERLLPLWMDCFMEAGGTITIAANIMYDETSNSSSTTAVPLFRLVCDTRTGQFLPVFSSSTMLLRSCACHDIAASRVAMALYSSTHSASSTAATSAKTTISSFSMSGPKKRPRSEATTALRDLTGRIIRDAFEGLARSMDNLSHKAGVGANQWDDYEDHEIGAIENSNSAKLRANAVANACEDVKQSLMTCCAAAAVYGIGASALSLAFGVDAMIDMAGGILTNEESEISTTLLPSPPVCVVLDQHIKEEKVALQNKIRGDEPKQNWILERHAIAITGCANEDYLRLLYYEVKTETSDTFSVPFRTSCVSINLPPSDLVLAVQSAMKLDCE